MHNLILFFLLKEKEQKKKSVLFLLRRQQFEIETALTPLKRKKLPTWAGKTHSSGKHLNKPIFKDNLIQRLTWNSGKIDYLLLLLLEEEGFRWKILHATHIKDPFFLQVLSLVFCRNLFFFSLSLLLHFSYIYISIFNSCWFHNNLSLLILLWPFHFRNL